MPIAFPRLLYRVPGPHQRPGGTFDHRLAKDADEAAELLTSGWHPSVPDAIDDAARARPVVTTMQAEALAPNFPAASDDEPPTRDELLQKAAELGIEVDGRWGLRTLSEKVTRAVKKTK